MNDSRRGVPYCEKGNVKGESQRHKRDSVRTDERTDCILSGMNGALAGELFSLGNSQL